MKISALLGLIVATCVSTQAISTQAMAAEKMAAEDQVLKELVPTGKLRVGLAYAPAPTPIFVARDGANVSGPAFDIGNALAKKLGVPVELLVTATTGELTEAGSAGTIDIGFMPADEARKQRLDFSPPYFMIESTFLTTAASGIKSMGEIDRPGLKVVGIDGSTTLRAATRTLKQATVTPAKSVDEAMAMMKAGDVQAFALTHDALPKLQKQLPGSVILDGAFQTVGVAIGIQKNKPAALAYVKAFVEDAKKDGTIRKAFDSAGLQSLSIAP
ncbi:ABC transporter substrate-binding protein [soil metagenome]